MKRQPITEKTKVDPIEAAIAVAQFCPLDPALYLERCGLAGITVWVADGRLWQLHWDEKVEVDQSQMDFLTVWLNLTPGGRQAVKNLLRHRSNGAQP
jgi:hypothetical protein